MVVRVGPPPPLARQEHGRGGRQERRGRRRDAQPRVCQRVRHPVDEQRRRLAVIPRRAAFLARGGDRRADGGGGRASARDRAARGGAHGEAPLAVRAGQVVRAGHGADVAVAGGLGRSGGAGAVVAVHVGPPPRLARQERRRRGRRRRDAPRPRVRQRVRPPVDEPRLIRRRGRRRQAGAVIPRRCRRVALQGAEAVLPGRAAHGVDPRDGAGRVAARPGVPEAPPAVHRRGVDCGPGCGGPGPGGGERDDGAGTPGRHREGGGSARAATEGRERQGAVGEGDAVSRASPGARRPSCEQAPSPSKSKSFTIIVSTNFAIAVRSF